MKLLPLSFIITVSIFPYFLTSFQSFAVKVSSHDPSNPETAHNKKRVFEHKEQVDLHQDNTAANVRMDFAEYAKDLETRFQSRFQSLQEDMRGRQRKLEERIQEQSDVIADLLAQAQKEREQFEQEIAYVNAWRELVLTLFKNLDEMGGVAEGRENRSKSSGHAAEPQGERQSRSDDLNMLEPTVDRLANRVQILDGNVMGLQNRMTGIESRMGTTYVRWGSKTCPPSTELVYSGYAGGSWYDKPGSAVNYLCLPTDPVFDDHAIPPVVSAHNHVQELYGAEYQASSEASHDMLPACCLCRLPRAAALMVPATTTCPSGWHLEYHGYLMAGATTHASGSEFVCVDSREEFIQGTNGNENGKLFYYTVTRCGSLPCPPYVNNKVVTCVMCSK